jgi:hypothetical protein
LRVFGYGFGKAVAALGELPAVAADEMTISGRQVRESFGKRRNRRQAEQKDRVVVGKAAVGLALTTAVAVVAGVVVDGIVSSENSIPTPRWTQPDPQAPTPRTNANPRSRNAIRTFNGMTEEQWIERIDGEGSSTQEAAMIVGKVFNGGATDALQNMVASGANSPVAIQNGPYSHKFLLATAGASLENAVESGDELDAKRATWALNNWSSPPRAVEQRVDQVRDELDAGTSRQQWQNDAEQLLKELNAHGLQTTLAVATPTRIQHFGLAD